LIEVIRNNPFQSPLPYEKTGKYLRKINIQHRLVPEIVARCRKKRELLQQLIITTKKQLQL